MHRFNYREIRTPIFEETSFRPEHRRAPPTSWGRRCTFTDRSETSLTLKPEMTAGVVRAYIQNNMGENAPVKVYYISPMFRQERPQAGRLRQFHQYGAEAIGGGSFEIDAEIITLAASVLEGLASPGTVSGSIRWDASSAGQTTRRNSRSSSGRNSHPLGGEPLCSRPTPAAYPRFRERNGREPPPRAADERPPLRGMRRALHGLKETLRFSASTPKLMARSSAGWIITPRRRSKSPAPTSVPEDALAGGGPDLLTEQLGGKKTPAVGFAGGMERLLMVRENSRRSPGPFPLRFHRRGGRGRTKVGVCESGETAERGDRGGDGFLGRSLKSQMREADRQQARYVIVVGQNEVTAGNGTMKEMATGGTQTPVALDALAPLYEAAPGNRGPARRSRTQ